MLQLLESNSLPDVLSKSSFYDPIRWLCSCFCLSCTWFVLLTSPTNHTSCINCRYSVKLVRWRARPVVPELTETLLCSFSPDFSWLIPTSPHTHLHSPIWWKLICSVWVFTPLFRLRDFSLRCQLYIFSKCVPVIKEKGHTAGPQTTGEGRYKRYWNWLLIFPLLTACPLRQRAVSSLHTWAWRFSSHSGCSVHSCFSLCEPEETARVPCHFLFACLLSSVMTGSLRICQSDILMQSQAQSDFWSSSNFPLLEISIQPLKALDFPGCMHLFQGKIFSARFMAALETTQMSMWVNIIHSWQM